MNLTKIITQKGFLIKHVASVLDVSHATLINWNKKPENITTLAHNYFSKTLGKEYKQWYKTILKQ